MDVCKFKQDIESKMFGGPYILVTKDQGLISHYIGRIQEFRDLKYIDYDSIFELLSSVYIEDSIVYVIKKDTFKHIDEAVLNLQNLLIVCSDIEDCTPELSKYIIRVGFLEDWQVQDYISSQLGSGVSKNFQDKLFKRYRQDFTKLELELSKLKCLSNSTLIEKQIEEQVSGAASDLKIFNCISCLIKGESENFFNVYCLLKGEDTFKLVSLLIMSVKNAIKVLASNHPTEEHTGLSSKQIYAIKKTYSGISVRRLVNLYVHLIELYKEIRLGCIGSDFIVDTIIYMCYDCEV